MWDDIAVVIGAYILGSLPIVYLIGRLRGVDLRDAFDLHLSLWREVGHKEGFVGITWDILKGVIVVLGVKWAGFSTPTVACAGLAVVTGEMWSIFYDFRGEKANTTGLGMASALAYQALPFGLIPMAAGAIFKLVSSLRQSEVDVHERFHFSGVAHDVMPLTMALGFLFFPIGSLIMGLAWEITTACAILFVMIMVKRTTAGLGADLDTATNKTSVIINRLLYDRSYH